MEVIMKKARFLGSIVLIAIFFCPGLALCAPKAVVMSPVYDAGEISQGKEISNVFLLKNEGNEPLTFKVRPC
jgi:hypothetical protein